MSTEQLLYAACGGLVSAVVYLFMKLQKRTDQMIQLAVNLRNKNGKDKENYCPLLQENKETKNLD
jgi:hypothetical protein